MSDDEKRQLVLDLFAQDVRAGLDAAVVEKRLEVVTFIEELWDKYRVTLITLKDDRRDVESRLEQIMTRLAYR
jgi:hypothetical protein